MEPLPSCPRAGGRDHTLRYPPPPTLTDPWPPSRISGDAAFDKDILGSVSEQIQKNFARNHWKVSMGRAVDLFGSRLPPFPPALSLSLRGRPPVASLTLEISGFRTGHSLIALSPCSEHSMPPLSCATSESWGRAQRVRRAQSGGWPATATRASGLASPPTGDAQVRGGGPCPPPIGGGSWVSLEGVAPHVAKS